MDRREKNFGRRLLAAGLCVMTAGFLLNPVPVRAEVADESTYDSSVTGSSQTYYRTIATNYHAGSIPGLVTTTTAGDMEAAVGIGAGEKTKGYEPVLYVADYDWKSDERKKADQVAQEMGGNLVAMLDIQLFRYEDTWFAPVHETELPVRLVAEIPEKSHKDGNEYTVLTDYRDYVMIRVHNGEVTVLQDLDSDLRTLTFETDRFSAYGLAYVPQGAAEEYNKNKTGTQTKPQDTPQTSGSASGSGQNQTAGGQETANQAAVQSGAADSELDEVPKTGDILWELENGCTGIAFEKYHRASEDVFHRSN